MNSRPKLVTIVGIIGLIAGIFPVLESAALLTSQSFRAWFLPIVQRLLPFGFAATLSLLVLIAVVDLALGTGVLTKRRWAL
jgi:hypothetical protein